MAKHCKHNWNVVLRTATKIVYRCANCGQSRTEQR